MRFKYSATLAAVAACFSFHALQTLDGQEVRRAIPVEPPTAPAVPFDFDKPSPTPTPAPVVVQPVTIVPTPVPATPSPALITTQSPDKEQLDYANSLYAKKMHDMAAPEYEKYISLFPRGPDLQTVYFRLAESYRGAGSTNAAITNYTLLLTSFDEGEFVGPAAYRLADLYFQQKNYEMALPMYRRASVHLADKTAVNSAKFFTARCLENLQSPTDAMQTYQDLTDTKDNNPFREASRLALARLLSDSGKKIEAHKQYELLAKETDKPEIRIEALVKASLLKIDLGQYDTAATDLQRALQQPEIGPWKVVAQTGLMHAWYETAKYKQLVDYYAANTKDFSTEALPEVLLLTANGNRKLGNYEKALPLYDQIIKNYPDSTYALEAQYQRLVSLYYANSTALVPEIDKYLAANPASDKNSQIILLKAEALYRKQKFAEAIPVYASLQGSTLSDELMADAQFKLGWCQMQTKDFAGAIKSFSQFLLMYPKNKLVASALTQRAVASQQTGDFATALKDFDELIASYPKAKERELALQQKALILGQQQDNQGMSDTFAKLLKEYPQTAGAAQANYWIGWAAFTAKDYKNAVPPLETARKLDKDQFFEKATLYIMTCYLYLEDKEKLVTEVDAYPKTGTKIKIPVQILRWLGAQYLNDKNYEQAEKFLTMVTMRKDDVITDDWLNLGRCLSSQHRSDEAIQAFTSYLDGAKEPVPRATGLLALGDAQLSLGKYDDAQKSVDAACALQPEGKMNAEGRILSGEIQMARGDYTAAAKLFESVSVLLDDPVITPHAMELAIDALKKAGKDADAAKVLNDLQTRYAEYLEQKKNGN